MADKIALRLSRISYQMSKRAGNTVYSDSYIANAIVSIYDAAIDEATDVSGITLPLGGLGATLSWDGKIITIDKEGYVLKDNMAGFEEATPTGSAGEFAVSTTAYGTGADGDLTVSGGNISIDNATSGTVLDVDMGALNGDITMVTPLNIRAGI